MPNFATLLHPIECPVCGSTRGRYIEFMQGFFAESSQVDLRLGELLALQPGGPFDRAFKRGFRTHGFFLCDDCQAVVTCLLAVRDFRVVEVEVFPKSVQDVLSKFPDCLFLMSSDDRDMVLLSDLLQKHGARPVVTAIRHAAKAYFTKAYWAKRSQQDDALTSNPTIHLFLRLLQSEDPESDPSPVSPWMQTLERVSALFDDRSFRRALRRDEKAYESQQRRKHKLLRQNLR